MVGAAVFPRMHWSRENAILCVWAQTTVGDTHTVGTVGARGGGVLKRSSCSVCVCFFYINKMLIRKNVAQIFDARHV